MLFPRLQPSSDLGCNHRDKCTPCNRQNDYQYVDKCRMRRQCCYVHNIEYAPMVYKCTVWQYCSQLVTMYNLKKYIDHVKTTWSKRVYLASFPHSKHARRWVLLLISTISPPHAPQISIEVVVPADVCRCLDMFLCSFICVLRFVSLCKISSMSCRMLMRLDHPSVRCPRLCAIRLLRVGIRSQRP